MRQSLWGLADTSTMSSNELLAKLAEALETSRVPDGKSPASLPTAWAGHVRVGLATAPHEGADLWRLVRKAEARALVTPDDPKVKDVLEAFQGSRIVGIE